MSDSYLTTHKTEKCAQEGGCEDGVELRNVYRKVAVKMVWTSSPSHLSQMFCTAEISNKEMSEIFCWGEP
jgi:hypothetical protein